MEGFRFHSEEYRDWLAQIQTLHVRLYCRAGGVDQRITPYNYVLLCQPIHKNTIVEANFG